MSTVIWRNGKLFADTQYTYTCTTTYSSGKIETTTTKIGTGSKIFHVNNKIYGATGTIEGWKRFANEGFNGKWLWGFSIQKDATIFEWDGKKLIIWFFKQKKFLGIYFSCFIKKYYTIENVTYYAMGSGNEYAVKALDLGLTPKEAIQYASDRDPFTNDKIEVVVL